MDYVERVENVKMVLWQREIKEKIKRCIYSLDGIFLFLFNCSLFLEITQKEGINI